MAEMVVTLDRGRRFVARVRGFQITSDQPAPAGADTAPTPAELLIASLGTCIGVRVATFVEQNEIKHDGFQVHLAWEREDDSSKIGAISVRIEIPGDVPEGLREPLRQAAKQCLVHQTLTQTPEIKIEVG